MEELIRLLETAVPMADFSDTEADLLAEGIITSIDIITIVAEITDHYGIDIPAEEMDMDHFRTVSEMYAMVQRIQAQQ